MTTRVTVEVPLNSTYQVEIETQGMSSGQQDDGVHRSVVKPGDMFSFYIYNGVSVKSIREVPIRPTPPPSRIVREGDPTNGN
jgi:hypothetical protein